MEPGASRRELQSMTFASAVGRIVLSSEAACSGCENVRRKSESWSWAILVPSTPAVVAMEQLGQQGACDREPKGVTRDPEELEPHVSEQGAEGPGHAQPAATRHADADGGMEPFAAENRGGQD